MNFFGNELSQIRKRIGFTQYQLAKELNLSRSHIFRVENGERNPNKELISKISEVLKLNKYDITKLLILANIDPIIENTSDDFKMVFHLALELKNKGINDKAKNLIEIAMTVFDSIIELNALLANLNLLNNDYEGAINANESTIKSIEQLSEDQKKKLGITRAEVIHNLGYVYFERGLEKNGHKDKLLVENWQNPNSEIESFIDELEKEIDSDFNLAIEKIELAYSLESENLHILDQLARLYYHKADLSQDKSKKELLFRKSVELYEIIINSDKESIESFKKQEASIFLSVALGKLFILNEAVRLINTIINYKPLYYLGYYAKSCIYSVNGKDNKELLDIAYTSLFKAIELNPLLKDDIKWEVDLYNLRFSEFFKNRFNELYSIQERLENEKD